MPPRDAAATFDSSSTSHRSSRTTSHKTSNEVYAIMRLILFHLFYIIIPYFIPQISTRIHEPPSTTSSFLFHHFLGHSRIIKSHPRKITSAYPKRTKMSSSIFPRSEKSPHTRQNELEHHRGIKGGQWQGGCHGQDEEEEEEARLH